MHHLILILALIEIFPLAIAAPCNTSCGDMEVSFPFGLHGDRPDCYLNKYYTVNCSRNSTHVVPYLGDSNIQVTNISLVEHELRVVTFLSRDCYDAWGNETDNNNPYLEVRTFPISYTKNIFTAIGCDTYAVLSKSSGFDYGDDYKTGCLTTCTDRNSAVDGSCSGIGCCQTGIPRNAYSFEIKVSSYNNHLRVSYFNNCSYAFVAAKEFFNFSTAYLSRFDKYKVPIVLDWSVGNVTCKEEQTDPTSYMCKGNYSTCLDADNGTGYRCRCKEGYQGNPYLSGNEGCRDINECNNATSPCDQIARCENTIGNFTCRCPKGYRGDGRKDGTGCTDIDECSNATSPCDVNASCKNTEGNFNCTCNKGYHGDGMKDGSGCKPTGGKESLIKDVVIAVGITIPSLLLLCSWIYWGLRQRKILMQREKFFQQNGGFLLQKLITEHKGSMETTTIFTNGELKKATNNYHESTILGQGGHGIVYKGVLGSKTVAIKKSKFVDQTQVREFINEVVILTQVNHKNVVKLIGCCLEKEVPLLVYEFITNGTLFDHIHKADHHAHMSWRSRLRIAAETAGALSYLHSDATTQIIHGDIKTANILLDDNFTAKVSDFGASKLVVVDQTQVSMLVQGTLGYLDPEYLDRMEMTDKSDVYSFGVVLAELLTGMKAFPFARPQKEKSLSMYFVSKYKQGNLLEIIDKRIFQDEFVEEIKEVAKLATRCLQIRGEERPAMREVSMELEGLFRATKRDPWAVSNSDEAEYLLIDEVNEYGEITTSKSMPCNSTKNEVAFRIESGR